MNSAPMPQLTFRAVALAIVLAMILAAANAYLGLFAGLTIATAIPAAVVSMGAVSYTHLDVYKRQLCDKTVK